MTAAGQNSSESKPDEESSRQSSEWAHRILNSKFFNDDTKKKDEKWGYGTFVSNLVFQQWYNSTISFRFISGTKTAV